MSHPSARLLEMSSVLTLVSLAADRNGSKMPSGVIFIICIPSSNYEHILKFGKPKDMIPYEDTCSSKQCRLQVELRNKKSRSIPVHLTQEYYNEGFNPTLENISEDDERITMENILEELLRKLSVEHAVWVSDKSGNYMEVMFPLPTGDPCETMLHCLTKLGIGRRWRSIVSVLPCNVVHSALDNEADEETIFDYSVHRRKTEDAKRWRSFVESIRSKLTVKQVVDGVRGGGELTFDYLTLIITADSLAALGLVENNASNIVAAMLVSPLMGPVMSITFGTIISDRTLIRNGFESLVVGMLFSLLFGFIFGLILGSTAMPWGYGDFPTEEMKSRGNVRSLWMGVLWALTSGTGVALALLQGSAGPLIGIAISASLLPPVVNCGLFWALACIWLLHPGVKIPHIKGEPYVGNSSYEPLYHDYLPIEYAINGIVSCCLTIVNVICIFITAIMFLKIKEVAAPYTSTPDLRRFWEQDIRVAREANRASLRRAEDDERTELMLDDLNQVTETEIREKLEAAVAEALDDETYRKVKRMSYQSHNANEVIRTIGLQSRTPVSIRSSQRASGSSTPHKPHHKDSNTDDIAALDKLLTSLLGFKEYRRSKSFSSHRNTPRSSQMPVIDELKRNRRSESWPDRIFENTVVRSVLTSLKTSKRNSAAEEPFLTPN
ncbi:uncharacterized protein LOC126372458 isoform X1 [Pectinophora gossypiella]|uniref:uncharacterized protein LOC126372458 isoform X1 n=1 Tax=Pectinophora gossypiella TaxID=13191 RepID=UPI00214E44DF|nr:uncharacterized protein LOC126372458 isoform X1 [Pectinophora gossypiella]